MYVIWLDHAVLSQCYTLGMLNTGSTTVVCYCCGLFVPFFNTFDLIIGMDASKNARIFSSSCSYFGKSNLFHNFDTMCVCCCCCCFCYCWFCTSPHTNHSTSQPMTSAFKWETKRECSKLKSATKHTHTHTQQSHSTRSASQFRWNQQRRMLFDGRRYTSFNVCR